MSDWSTLQRRVAGKWQIPLLLVSCGLLGGSVLHLRSEQAYVTPEQSLHNLESLVADGLFEQAGALSHLLLSNIDENQTDAQRASIHHHTARAQAGLARRDAKRTAAKGRSIVDHFEFAETHGRVLSAADVEAVGRAQEWQGRYESAIESYAKALTLGVDGASDLRKHIIAVKQELGKASPEELNTDLDDLLASVEEFRLDLRLWAIENKLELLDEMDRLDEASTLLVSNRERFDSSDLGDRFHFLEAMLLHRTGHNDTAETCLRTMRNAVDPADDPMLAMTGWLLGRVILSGGGPQRAAEAISFFTDVLERHPSKPYTTVCRLGMAEALALLERHDEALSAFRLAIEELATIPRNRLIDRNALRLSLSVTADTQRTAGHLQAALDYARLAVTLIDRANEDQTTMLLQQLVEVLSQRAQELDRVGAAPESTDAPPDMVVSEDARRLYAEAAATCLDLAKATLLNEQRSADASWRAADFFARAGERDRAIERYRTFSQEHPSHSLVPRALARIGRLNQVMGRFAAAIDTYQECYRRFPRTIDGARTLVPLATCFLASGPGSEELAEKTLLIVLEDSEVFTPQAPEFTDALFLLGDVLNRRGEFERAIATLDEAALRYPDDPRVPRSRYLMADSFRLSALTLKRAIKEDISAVEAERIRAESAQRFDRALDLYRNMITEYEIRGLERLSALEQVYLRHAYLYEADCYFEIHDYRTALKLYEEAAGAYRDRETALAAYVQIINCHVFLGEMDEARAALSRAMILAGAIPDQAFARSVSPESREDWKRYLEWLGRSELF